MPQKASFILKKLLDSALANAKQKKYVDIDNLYVKNVLVDGGPMLKRFLPRAMGRATKIRKRMSHITLILDES
jgi:large subunit ribosomal protein L22